MVGRLEGFAQRLRELRSDYLLEAFLTKKQLRALAR